MEPLLGTHEAVGGRGNQESMAGLAGFLYLWFHISSRPG